MTNMQEETRGLNQRQGVETQVQAIRGDLTTKEEQEVTSDKEKTQTGQVMVRRPKPPDDLLTYPVQELQLIFKN